MVYNGMFSRKKGATYIWDKPASAIDLIKIFVDQIYANNIWNVFYSI